MTTSESLTRAATHAHAALKAAGLTAVMAKREGAAQTIPWAESARESARAALGELLAAGAEVPDQAPDPAPIPLHQLDTPDVRALAAGLRELLPIAERIDAARGRALPEVVGGSAGLDLAEDLAQMVARLELEAYGPAASVTGGRE